MSWRDAWDKVKGAANKVLSKLGVVSRTEAPPAYPTYPRYSHVSLPITDDLRWLARMFGNRTALLNAERGVTVRNPVRQVIKQLERDPTALVATFNNKQRRKWRAKVRKHTETSEVQQ